MTKRKQKTPVGYDVRLNFKVTRDLQQLLKRAAFQLQCSEAAFIRACLRDGLQHHFETYKPDKDTNE